MHFPHLKVCKETALVNFSKRASHFLIYDHLIAVGVAPEAKLASAQGAQAGSILFAIPKTAFIPLRNALSRLSLH